MDISFEVLKKRYSELELEELLKLKDKGLIDIAQKALVEELKDRGINE